MALVSFLVRHYSSGVRVRFAPSPTGQLHLGGFRTALYNYLFAKSSAAASGKFVLRIEDTDQNRLVPGAADHLESMLQWVGIEADESPLKGGDFGPYVQSERLNLYRTAVDTLLESGQAYRCFCSEKRLELLKKEAARLRVNNRYDRRCLGLSDSEIQAKLEAGTPHTVRFKLRPFPEPFQDVIFGPVSFNVFEIEGDPIIYKSDGFPTYHLANVVDDHHMQISHVLRGVEWQISTPKHLLLYEALGWDPPQYAHLPLIMNSDGTKLSKRQSDIHLESYRAMGIYPEAVLNFSTLLGGGFEDREHSTDYILDLKELQNRFRLTRIGTHSSRMEFQRLRDLNRTALKRRLETDEEAKLVVADLRARLEKMAEVDVTVLDYDYLMKILRWSLDRIFAVQDLVTDEFKYIWTDAFDLSELQLNPQILQECSETLQDEKQDLSKSMRKIAARHEVKFALVMKSVRLALSGTSVGPPVKETIDILGQDRAIQRLTKAIKHLQS